MFIARRVRRSIVPVTVDASFGEANATVGIGDTRSGLEMRKILREREKNSSVVVNKATCQGSSPAHSPVIYSRNTSGQVVYPAEEEDIAILSNSRIKFADPRLTEGSVVIRIVRLSDPVSSPVARVQRNRFFGIRDYEKYTFLAWGLCATLGVASLGIWQLRRMDYKAKLIERRRNRLSLPRIVVDKSPFPWNENNLIDFEYRTVELTGVLDHAREMYVGPRASGVSLESSEYGQMSQVGYNVVTPLMLADGNCVLVNRGLLTSEWIRNKGYRKREDPEWVTVRGVLVTGELSGIANDSFRVKNSSADKNFVYLVPADLAETAAPRNFSECRLALVNAFDCRYLDNPRRARPPYQVKRKADYMCFYADEHVHFNYAMQWFGMSAVFLCMTLFKFREMIRWRW